MHAHAATKHPERTPYRVVSAVHGHDRRRHGRVRLGVRSKSSNGTNASTAARRSTTSSSATATTVPSQAFGTAICTTYLAVIKREPQPSRQARALIDEFRALPSPPASSRPAFDALISSLREVMSVWSSAAPTATTTDEFASQAREASAKFGTAAQGANMNPCPRPRSDASTTTAAASTSTTPSWTFDTVARVAGATGIFLYFSAQCPAGTALAVVKAPWQPNPGAPESSYAVLVGSLAPEAAFTPADADRAFAQIPAFSGMCR